MAQPFATRRASIYRAHARELAQAATHEWRADVRRHILDQAASFQRAADALAAPHVAKIPSISLDRCEPEPG